MVPIVQHIFTCRRMIQIVQVWVVTYAGIWLYSVILFYVVHMVPYCNIRFYNVHFSFIWVFTDFSFVWPYNTQTLHLSLYKNGTNKPSWETKLRCIIVLKSDSHLPTEILLFASTIALQKWWKMLFISS